MDNNFKKGREEFREKNYEKALEYFDNIMGNSDDYEHSLFYKITCLIELKCYEDALAIINPLIGKNPYDELLWFDKATCHIFLKDDEKAFKTLDEIVRIVDMDDKMRVICIAKFYNLLGDYDNALKYCDMALAIDGKFKEAIYEKSHVAIRLDDNAMIDEMADRLFEISGGDILSLTSVFLLKLFAKNFRGCLDIIENSIDEEVKDETIEMFKSIVFKELSEDLNARILVSEEVNLSVDEALKLLFDFKEKCRDHGEIRGVKYMII